MKNNEIQKITKNKSQLEKFYILRNEIVKESCKSTLEKSKEHQQYIKRHPNDKAILINPSIRQRILEDLEEEEFIMDEKGTQYIATLATIYFHERKLFRRKDIEDNGYFDLKPKNNAHYSMLGTTPSKAVEEMCRSITHSGIYFITLEELIYELADKYIHLLREDNDEKNIPYTKKLLKK